MSNSSEVAIATTWRERARSTARDAILEAATEVFARKGYHGATLEEIAKAAGYTGPAIYRYFKGKKALYAAVLEHIIDGFSAIVEEPPPIKLSFADRLRWLLSRLFSHAEAQRSRFVALATHELRRSELSAELQGCARQRLAHFAQVFTELMREGVAAGELRGDVPVTTMAVVLQGIIDGVIKQWIFEPDPPEPLADKVEPLITLFLGGAGRQPSEDG